MKVKLTFLFSLLLIFGFQNISKAQEKEFSQWLEEFKQEALQSGISGKTLEKALAGISYNSKIIELDRNQPEFTLTLSQYLDRMISKSRIDKGLEELRDNKDILRKIENLYGVSPNYLVALWGMESYYCRYTGDFPILEALATLTYDPRRSLFFKKELLAALHLLDSEVTTIDNLKGSWAGAMGCLQFLPSVFRKYGVDYDGNGRQEIFEAGGDLFACAANYLKSSGWQTGKSWGAEVTIPADMAGELLTNRKNRPLSYWLRKGIEFKDNRKIPEENPGAALIQPDKRDDRYFLIFANFEVLLKWNRSDYYAIATGKLADHLGSLSK